MLIVFNHFYVADRLRLRIDGHTARVASVALKSQAEHLKLVNEYQAAINTFRQADMERRVKAAELRQRMEEIVFQRRANQRLQGLRLENERFGLHRDRLAIRLEIAKLRKELREAGVRPEPKLSPAQQRALKKAEVEDQLQGLIREEAVAMQRAAAEPEKRRLQNMYANRRDQLMEQLENLL